MVVRPARVAASVLGKRVDHAVVEDLERVVEARRRLDDALGGGSLLPATREDLRLVVALLKNSSYTEEVGQRLHAVAAEFARLAGWLAYDSNQHALAQRYFMAALRAAHVSGDRAVGANILGFMSYQSARIGDPRDALALAESAIAGAQTVTPAVMASLEARRALGSAHTGKLSAFFQAQDRTFELLATSSRSKEPPWIYWFTESDAHGMAGQALLALNRPRDAADHLRQAVKLIDPAFVRDRALWLSQLAAARVLDGRLEQGCTTASEAAALLRRLDSTRVTEQLADFRRAANPYASSAAVREFDAKYRDLIMRTTSA
ncbi:MAG: hypothetical protein ACRDSL_01475 [Pseudonocardiaceae bacterium]